MTRARSLGIAVLLVATLVGGPARAEAPEACASAAEQAQTLRDQHKLLAARERLVICANGSCPVVVQRFCVRWLGEVDAVTPTIVIRARDGRGRDVIGVRVSLDGKPFLERLDGSAVPVDPGPHRLLFETPSGERLNEDLLLAEGDKNRIVTASLRSHLRVDGTEETEVALPPGPRSAQQPTQSPSRIPAIAVGVVGLAALGTFAYFEAAAWSQYDDRKSVCGSTQTCSPADVDSIRTKFVVAGTSLGIGVVALGVAGWLFVTSSRPRSAPAAAFDVRALPGGGVATVRGAF